MKCDMAVQTEVALQNIGYVSDLGRGEAIISPSLLWGGQKFL